MNQARFQNIIWRFAPNYILGLCKKVFHGAKAAKDFLHN